MRCVTTIKQPQITVRQDSQWQTSSVRRYRVGPLVCSLCIMLDRRTEVGRHSSTVSVQCSEVVLCLCVALAGGLHVQLSCPAPILPPAVSYTGRKTHRSNLCALDTRLCAAQIKWQDASRKDEYYNQKVKHRLKLC